MLSVISKYRSTAFRAASWQQQWQKEGAFVVRKVRRKDRSSEAVLARATQGPCETLGRSFKWPDHCRELSCNCKVRSYLTMRSRYNWWTKRWRCASAEQGVCAPSWEIAFRKSKDEHETYEPTHASYIIAYCIVYFSVRNRTVHKHLLKVISRPRTCPGRS